MSLRTKIDGFKAIWHFDNRWQLVFERLFFASQPLAVWRAKGWIYHEDPRGWFQWYCRYFMGRRCADDERQIKRWRAAQRHVAQLKKNCPRGALDCRRKQRQALLHWAYDSRKL